MNVLSELEQKLMDFEEKTGRQPDKITMSPRKWYEFLASLPLGTHIGHDCALRFLGIAVVKGAAPGLNCRSCGAPYEPQGGDNCTYCKTPKHVIELT